MGKQFDPKEPSTFGIDTSLCRVKEVDKSWQERVKDKGDDVTDCIVWNFKNKRLNEGQRSYIFRLHTAAMGLLIALVVFPNVIIQFGWSNCMKFLVCVSMCTLFWSKNVELYLTIRNLAEAIFIINSIGGLFLLTKRPIPTFALGIVSFFLAMQKGIVMVCQIRMGISAVLGVTLLAYIYLRQKR